MADTREERIEEIIERLIEEDSPSIVTGWNEYSDANYCEPIYTMGDFDLLMEGRSPSDIAGLVYGTDFNTYDAWFWFDGDGYLNSSDYLDDTPIDAAELAEYACDNCEAFGIQEICDVLDEDEDEAA